MITLYGIKNCDTVKKARKWLEQYSIDYSFHDFRTDGLTAKQLNGWIAAAGWETLLNKRGTTFRNLDDSDKANLDAARAAELMLQQPALIKRPVLIHGNEIVVGFKPDVYLKLVHDI